MASDQGLHCLLTGLSIKNRIKATTGIVQHLTVEESTSIQWVKPLQLKSTFFAGRYCDEDVDECDEASICQNGGTCKNSVGSYMCICVNGWTGKNCEENIDDCQLQPCYGGGTCIDKVGYYICECPYGKIGM